MCFSLWISRDGCPCLYLSAFCLCVYFFKGMQLLKIKKTNSPQNRKSIGRSPQGGNYQCLPSPQALPYELSHSLRWDFRKPLARKGCCQCSVLPRPVPSASQAPILPMKISTPPLICLTAWNLLAMAPLS